MTVEILKRNVYGKYILYKLTDSFGNFKHVIAYETNYDPKPVGPELGERDIHHLLNRTKGGIQKQSIQLPPFICFTEDWPQ